MAKCTGVSDLSPLARRAEEEGVGPVPVPLWKARNILLRALRSNSASFFEDSAWETRRERSATERAGPGLRTWSIRLVVRLDTEELGEGQSAPLAWFGAQPTALDGALEDPTFPRVCLRAPSSSSSSTSSKSCKSGCDSLNNVPNTEGVAAAGLGAAHILTGAGPLDGDGSGSADAGAWEEAASVCPGMRYYGGARFEPLMRQSPSTGTAPHETQGVTGTKEAQKPSAQWQPYGGHWLVLPLVEVSSGGCSVSELDHEEDQRAGGTRRAPTLAVNIRWTSEDTDTAVSKGHVEGDAFSTNTYANTCFQLRQGCSPSASREETVGAARCDRELLRGVTAAAGALARERERAARALEAMEPHFATSGTEPELPLPIVSGNGVDEIMDKSSEEYYRWSRGIRRALEDMERQRYSKVVLARTAGLTFPVSVSPADVLIRFRNHYGFLFCLQPSAKTAFVGCTPERLFLSSGPRVVTEALAGTRGRGANPDEDARLGEELMNSKKDMLENEITADYVSAALRRAGAQGLDCSEPYLKRLTHVQHICRRIEATLSGELASTDEDEFSTEVTAAATGDSHPGEGSRSVGGARSQQAGKALLREMHPTPAVCGTPRDVTYQVIGEVEGFDRGFYAGPIGYISPGASEFGVAIRSALITTAAGSKGGCEMTLFAGCGIVPGSTASGEWAEAGMKMKNFLSLFPERPVRSLRHLPNANALWGALVIEELVRLGVRHFCVCPGSRSAPLAVAIARHPSAVSISHHDERGAGFYAVGFARAGNRGRRGRGNGNVFAVVTSSGTAVANLLPAATEADAAGLPMLLLTADRPPEARGCGSNQTIDQVNLFGSRSRLSVDVQCPTDDIDACALLSSIDRAVWKACGGSGAVGGASPGPVHINFMFRENLAPVGGAVREGGVPGLTSDWSDRCLDSPRMLRWEAGIEPFTRLMFERGVRGPSYSDLHQVANALWLSRRGLLVFGCLNGPDERSAARHLARTLGWPVYADVTSGLRWWAREAGLGVGRLDQLLLDDVVAGSLAPDAVVQVGCPLLSKRVQRFLSSPSVTLTATTSVICSPSVEWHDPGRAFSTRVACSVVDLAAAVDAFASRSFTADTRESFRAPGSELLGLVTVSDAAAGAQRATITGAVLDEVRPQFDRVGEQPRHLVTAAGNGYGGIENGCHGHTNGSTRSSSGGGGGGCVDHRSIPQLSVTTLGDANTSNGHGARERLPPPSPMETKAAAAAKDDFETRSRSDSRGAPSESAGRRAIPIPSPSPGLSPGGAREEAEEGAAVAVQLSEPFVAWCVTRDLRAESGLFLSASMPCRDVDAFADEDGDACGRDGGGGDERGRRRDSVAGGSSSSNGGVIGNRSRQHGGRHLGGQRLRNVASNRGASGIDGVLSSAIGYAAGLRLPVTVLIGDMATLHDLGSLHTLREASQPVTVVCVNNRGGGIFSFLPIGDTRHADAFSPFFDTPHTVDFEGVCRSMGLVYRRAVSPREFEEAYRESQGVSIDASAAGETRHYFIEAITASRADNVLIHRSLGQAGKAAALEHMLNGVTLGWEFTPPARHSHWGKSTHVSGEVSMGHGRRDPSREREGVANGELPARRDWTGKPTLLVLHGFMGSKMDWTGEFADLATGEGHAMLTVELPGHGGSRLGRTSGRQSLPRDQEKDHGRRVVSWGIGGVELCAEAVAKVCQAVGAGPYIVIGYSMGGRVALALAGRRPAMIAGVVLVSSHPGLSSSAERLSRWESDLSLASKIAALDDRRPTGAANKAIDDSEREDASYVSLAVGMGDSAVQLEGAREFLKRWYAAPLWGDMKLRRPRAYASMLDRRLTGAFGLQTAEGTGVTEAEFSPGDHLKNPRPLPPQLLTRQRASELARSCLALSVARQPDMWPLLRTLSEERRLPIAYVAGELDCRYGRSKALPVPAAAAVRPRGQASARKERARERSDVHARGQDGGVKAKPPESARSGKSALGTVAERVAAACPRVACAIVPDCGHAVLAEDPRRLYNEVSKVAQASVATERDGPRYRREHRASDKGSARGVMWVAGVRVGEPAEASRDAVRPNIVPVNITSFSLEEFSLPLTSPLQLPQCRLEHRRGVLVRLQGKALRGMTREQYSDASFEEEAALFCGVGEVTPLPGLHQESLDEAKAQLRAVLPLLTGRTTPTKLPALDGGLIDWLSEPVSMAKEAGGAGAKGGDGDRHRQARFSSAWDTHVQQAAGGGASQSLLSSVRSGIEMALLHLVSRASRAAIASAVSLATGIACRGSIKINGLAVRGEAPAGVAEGEPRVLKVKVGGDVAVEADAARAAHLLRQAAPGSALRLDANQAWDMDEALAFATALESDLDEGATAAGRVIGRQTLSVDYIEEPLRDPRLLEEFWERSGKALPYALDESLAMGREIFTDAQLLNLKGCRAFVIKVSVVGGLSRTVRLCRIARRIGATPVLSSAFESGVGLAHAAVLASCFSEEGVAHGLGTHTRFASDVVVPGFADTIRQEDVDIIKCQELLDAAADAGSAQSLCMW